MNYSPLQLNTKAGLSEGGFHIYLKLCDAYQANGSDANERRAFMEACGYDRDCGELLEYVARNSPAHDLDEDTIASVGRFVADRWFYNFRGRV